MTPGNPFSGNALGGAIDNGSGPLTVTNSQFVGNEAVGGDGISSSFGVNLGVTATGGAIDHDPPLANSPLNISDDVLFLSNEAIGGVGVSSGSGGNGGVAFGGAVADYRQGVC